MITVFIVEDSSVVREMLTYILSSDPDIRVVGTAPNGEEAVKAVGSIKPDVVTMDINMPKMDGFEATRRIMETTPTPIVIVSASYDASEVQKTFRAIEAGALAVLEKPVGLEHPKHQRLARELIRTVKLMSEIKVVKRRPRIRSPQNTPEISPYRNAAAGAKDQKIVAIGASTGGPPVIETILSGLPKNFSAPVLIVQHIAQGFVQGFAQWLALSAGYPVRIAEHNETALPGQAYLAPDNVHMGIAATGKIVLSTGAPENGLKPSVSYLFRSVAQTFGKNAVGVLLTGMGKDGALELKMMKDQGAATIAQNKESCVVFGMPGEAIRQEAAALILPPEKIASVLTAAINKS